MLNTDLTAHLRRVEEHLAPVDGDLVAAGLRRPEEDDVLVGEGLQRLGLAALIHRHVLSAHAQPQVMGEATLLTLKTHAHAHTHTHTHTHT